MKLLQYVGFVIVIPAAFLAFATTVAALFIDVYRWLLPSSGEAFATLAAVMVFFSAVGAMLGFMFWMHEHGWLD